jgi:hypothetical protein
MPRPRPRRFLLLLLVLLPAFLHGGAGTAAAATPGDTLGVYRGAAYTTGIQGWESWLGRPTYRVIDFLARESWDKIAAPNWWVDSWAASPYGYRVVYSVPMLPDSPATASLATGATGAYDVHYERLARLLISRGQGGATIRLGWEFNGDWYRWNAAVNPAAFVSYWRRIVNAMRRQPGAAFRFDWTINLGRGTVAPDAVYPGNSYVDFIGADVYDHGWAPGYQDPIKRWRTIVEQPYGLRWLRDFAGARLKRLSIPEWALVLRADGHGGGDDPYFVNRMYDWIAANNVAYHAYFESDMPGAKMRLMTGTFPRAAAEFRRLFGVESAAKLGTAGKWPRTRKPTRARTRACARRMRAERRTLRRRMARRPRMVCTARRTPAGPRRSRAGSARRARTSTG